MTMRMTQMPTHFAVDYGALKRAADVVLGCVLLTLLLPLLALIALMVAIESPGPVLYLHPRVGYRGQQFAMLKFRTMLRDRRAVNRPIPFPDRRKALKTRDDPRITRVGRVLRQ